MPLELLPLALSDLPIPASDPALLEALSQPRLALFWGAHTPSRTLLAAATVMAAGGATVRLFDGGNSFDGYFVARLARRLTVAAPGVLGRLRRSGALTA